MDKGASGLNDTRLVDRALVLVGPDIERVAILIEVGIYELR